MNPRWIEAIAATLSGEAAKQDTEAITCYVRSPGSSGYHEATNFVRRRLGEVGAEDVASERYPLDGETVVVGHTLPPAWEPLEAELRLLPERDLLVAYPAVPSCVPWWCPSTPDEGVGVEVVDVGAGLTDADYARREVAGKAVLLRHGTDDAEKVAWSRAVAQAEQYGAVGIITDYLLVTTPWRTRTGLADAVQLMRLPARWKNPWALTVDYTAAERLAARCREGRARVFVRIKTRLFKGEGQNLTGAIRGREHPEESVVFISHTSAATRPCANCAAGPALMIEIARTLRTLVERGTIPRPRRTIRFMFVAEGLGSMAHFARHPDDLPHMLCGINFDSVGHHQDKLKSSLVFYRVPDSLPTFINDLGQWLLESTPKEAAWPFKHEPVIPLVSFISLPYGPWSDNQRWNGMGIPCPLIMSWPDRYFHTQLLTADNTDPMVFHRAGVVSAALALAIADAGPDEAARYARLTENYGSLRIGLAVTRAIEAQTREGGAQGAVLAQRATRAIRHLAARDARAIETTDRLVRHEPADVRDAHARIVKASTARLRRQLREALALLETPALSTTSAPPNDDAGAVIPVPAYEGPPPRDFGLQYPEMADLVARMRTVDPRTYWDTLLVLTDELWNLSDGRRTLDDIAAIVSEQFGLNIEAGHLERLVLGIERAGHMRRRRRAARRVPAAAPAGSADGDGR